MPKPSRRSARRPGDRGDDGPAGLARLDRPHGAAVGPIGPFPAAIWGTTAFEKFRGDELLVHGLAGPARSPYVDRVAARLVGFRPGANLALKLAAEADVAPLAGLAFHAADDPFIPAGPFDASSFLPVWHWN